MSMNSIFLQETSSVGDLESDIIFPELGRRLSESPELASKARGSVFLWVITKGGKPAAQWGKARACERTPGKSWPYYSTSN